MVAHTAITNQPRLDSARLASVFVESLFNGIFWSHFYTCIQTLRKTSVIRKEPLFKPIFFVAWLLFLCILTHLIIIIYGAFTSFIPPDDAAFCVEPFGPTPAILEYSQLFRPWLVAESAMYVITTVVADAFLTYRLFVVWSHNFWIIIFPTLCLLALLATGMRAVSLFAIARDFIFGASLDWTLASFALTFGCNIYSTSLIAWRIFLSQRGIQKDKSHKTTAQKVQEVLIQSAAIYCVLVILSLAFMIVGSNASYITVAITTPTTGIIFCMIVNRTHTQAIEQYEQVHGRGVGRSSWYRNGAASANGHDNFKIEGPSDNLAGSHRASRLPATITLGESPPTPVSVSVHDDIP
ncbi:hypothetical protein D9613_006654 [Agrocybe pediades]|uniref:Uncharacterized protein n=1 Tax=Agrocybe pediades TaxID=84607 RepID=A0A8H4QGJ8_9AGAR|nr:hypothetical protein D9613_006654 [Agrocybe pediades]